MLKKVKCEPNYYSRSSIYSSLDIPNKCPICKHALSPEILQASIYKDCNDKYFSSLSFLCNNCYQAFIGLYSLKSVNDPELDFKQNSIVFISPNKFEKDDFSDIINDISPDFVTIYNQAFEAESRNMNQIAGIGYRKALEFLLKDFLISQNPKDEEADDEESIAKMPLSKCIDKYVENDQLKIVAKRATWLGNDQAHYVQKFNDKDIDYFKKLIRLTVHWINMIKETEEAAEIEPRK